MTIHQLPRQGDLLKEGDQAKQFLSDKWAKRWRAASKLSHAVIPDLPIPPKSPALTQAVHYLVSNLAAVLKSPNPSIVTPVNFAEDSQARYPELSRYNPPCAVCRKTMPKAWGLLADAGYVDVHKGKKGVTTTIAATSKLINRGAGIEEEYGSGGPIHYGYFRWSKKNDSEGLEEIVDISNRRESNRPLNRALFLPFRNLVTLNANNISHRWTMNWPGYEHLGSAVDDRTTQVNPNALVYIRVLNNRSGWPTQQRGGRFYNELTNIPRHLRLYLEVNGEELVYLDFRALHLRLLYEYELRQSAPAVDDSYALKSFPRSLVKAVITMLPNMKNLQREPVENWPSRIHRALHKEDGWPRSRKKCLDYNKHLTEMGHEPKYDEQALSEIWDEGRIRELLARIREVHAPLNSLWGTNLATKMQWVESRIAELVGAEFTKLKLPIHILHDGFFAQRSQEKKLRQTMCSAYKEVVGFELPPSQTGTPEYRPRCLRPIQSIGSQI